MHSPIHRKKEPLFSVIIPTFNRNALVIRAINSILSQTYEDFEVIVVDDGSTDNTNQVVSSVDDLRVVYIRQENKGRCAARNTGALNGRGQFITFLDSDDEAMPTWLESFLHAFLTHKATVVCCGMNISDPLSPKEMTALLPRDLGPVYAHQRGLFRAGTFAMKKHTFDAIGGYAEELAFSENTELALRLLPRCREAGWKIASIDQPLIIYHREPPEVRGRYEDLEKTLASSEYIICRHGKALNKSPQIYAYYLATAGVRAAKLGYYFKARGYFFSAVKHNPKNILNYLRLFITFVPDLSKKVWLRHCC